MNTILLITVMSTLALVHAVNESPCQNSTVKDKNPYKEFVRKHIFNGSFDRTSEEAWKSYLRNNSLCENRTRQSFMEQVDVVKKICNGKGHRVEKNLCMSDSDILVYDLNVRKNCKTIEILPPAKKKVIVGCDKVDNSCLPVHFEKYTNQKPTTEMCNQSIASA